MDIFYPLQLFADWVSYDLFQLNSITHLGAAVNFFVYDTLKILMLLLAVTLVMGSINAFFPIERVRDYLRQNKLFGFEYVLASLLGTITPFCSCSSVPLFIGFVKGGIPLGVTLTFLISSPLVDAVVIALLLSVFGFKVTIIYVVTGIIISVLAGIVLGKLNLETYLTDWVQQLPDQDSLAPTTTRTGRMVLKQITNEASNTFKKVYLYVIVGVALGAYIHGFVPTQFFETYIGADSVWAVPLAVLIGVPLYAGAAGVLPIAQVLVAKGVALGTVLAFMMATVGLSVPEALMLKKVMKWQLLAMFFGVVTIAIIISGYFFNVIF